MDQPMSTPLKYPEESPEKYFSDRELVEKTLQQVEKDFSLQGIDLCLNRHPKSYDELMAELADKLHEVETTGDEQLPALLYRIDLPEKEIFRAMEDSTGVNFYHFLADKILRRCFQKVILRRKYSGS